MQTLVSKVARFFFFFEIKGVIMREHCKNYLGRAPFGL